MCQPVQQLLLMGIQLHLADLGEQASAGIGLLTQTQIQPVFAGHIEYQAITAGSAETGMGHPGRHHGQLAIAQALAMSGYFQVQLALQAEHQLGVTVLVGQVFLMVVTHGEHRAARCKTEQGVDCHALALSSSSAGHERCLWSAKTTEASP